MLYYQIFILERNFIMKKNLALILALVMIIGSLFSVIPMAEGESASEASDENYVPEIAYANVNYTDSIYMMFAVPAPAALADDESVKLIVWDSRLDSIAFSYKDNLKDVLEAEETPVTIGDKSYLVFKFKGIDATEMTKTICARPVIVKGDTATSYGKLVEYSVLEYVATAKGEIDGIAGIDNEETINLLDDMLKFGALAQKYSGDYMSLVPTDDLHKIYVTAVLNGVEKDRVFSGFFKYTDGANVTIDAPFFDGTGIDKITNAEGVVLVDGDDFTDGLQIEAIDEDLELKVYYKNAVARTFNADIFGPGVDVNNASVEFSSGANNKISHASLTGITFTGYGTANLSGGACTFDSYNRMNYWHGVKTVASPVEGDDGVVFQFTATNAPCIDFNKVTAADFQGVGFGDTIYPAFTFEITLGMVDGKMPANVGSYYFRHRYTWGTNSKGADITWVNLFIFNVKDNKVIIYDGDNKTDNDVVVGEIPTTGMRKFAITLDAITGAMVCFAENESGVMEKTGETQIFLSNDFINRQNAYLEDPVTNSALACYENLYTFFTASGKLDATFNFGAGAAVQSDFENATVEIDGVEVPICTVDESGTKRFDMLAVRTLAERDYSFLMDDFNLVMGFAYE